MALLWTEKHRPRSAGDILGNRKAVEQVREFVRDFSGGKALLLHGPPGVGKSLAAELAAREEGLHLVELAASDERSAEEVQKYQAATQTRPLFGKGRMLVIDEVDGLAAGDRGGVQAILGLVKGSRVPVILIANDPWLPKLRPLRSNCTLVKFSRVPGPSIETFLAEVCKAEGLEAGEGVLKHLARFSAGDVRAALTDLQTVAMGRPALEEADLEAVGYRERELSVFESLPAIFRSGSLSAGRKAMGEGEKDPDEVLWWVEHNAHLEFGREQLAGVFDLLSRADLFRALVARQQHWAFKGYMADLIAGVSVRGGLVGEGGAFASPGRVGEGRTFSPGAGFVRYQAPDRLLLLGRTKQKRALVEGLCKRLGGELHCSKQSVRRDVLPYLRVMVGQGQDLGLEEGDLGTLSGK